MLQSINGYQSINRINLLVLSMNPNLSLKNQKAVTTKGRPLPCPVNEEDITVFTDLEAQIIEFWTPANIWDWKIKFRQLFYDPDKHQLDKTGMSEIEVKFICE